MSTFPPASGFYNVLDPANPTSVDFVEGGYAWFQWLQQNMVNQWPNLKAASTPEAANPNPQELNQLVGLGTTETLETRIARLESESIAIGTIKPWPVSEANLTNTYAPGAANSPGLGEWHVCNGATLDGSTTYASLYALIGNQYGGSTAATMQIPDIDGRVIAGRARTTSRLTGYRQGVLDTAQGNVGGEQAHVQALDELANHDHGRGGRNIGSITSTGSGAQQYNEENTATAGNSVQANVVQPTIIIAWYIRVN